MKYNLYIYVQQKHINSGDVLSSTNCPVMQAINECLKSDYKAEVGSANTIELRFGDRKIRKYAVNMPSIVYNFIVNFDKYNPVKPFVFVLPQVNERMIANLN